MIFLHGGFFLFLLGFVLHEMLTNLLLEGGDERPRGEEHRPIRDRVRLLLAVERRLLDLLEIALTSRKDKKPLG